LCALKNKDDFFEYCAKNLSYERKQPFNSYEAIDQYRWNLLYKLYRSSAVRTQSGFDVIVKYFFLKEIEAKNLFCLIEGIRYQMNPLQIRNYLTGFSHRDGEEGGIV
jgi:vacuolar-type H+-ATPase subunit C/Vma6